MSDAPIKLWNGRYYDHETLNRAAPGLADFARAHERLEEHFDSSVWEMFRAQIPMAAIAGVLVYVFGAAIFLVQQGPAQNLGGLLLGLLTLGVFFALIWLVVLSFFLLGAWVDKRYHNPRCVSVENAIVKFSAPGKEFHVDLADCCWCSASRGYADSLSRYFPRKGEVVLLVRSKQARGPRWPMRNIAVGFTPELRAMWVGLLLVSGNEQRASPRWST